MSNLCDLFIDGRNNTMNRTRGAVANVKFLGGGFMAAPEASISDGLLDLEVRKDSAIVKIVDELVHFKTGRYNGEEYKLDSNARKGGIISNERTATVDAEPVGILPATF